MGLRLLAIALLLSACGGSDVVSTVQAQEVPRLEKFHLHAILRPDSNGRWYVQSDVDHLPDGVSLTVEQTPEFVRIFFSQNYKFAGTIQVTSDDDFADEVKGYSNLGLNHATIRVKARGKPINPADVYQYIPPGSGNFWINVTMWK